MLRDVNAVRSRFAKYQVRPAAGMAAMFANIKNFAPAFSPPAIKPRNALFQAEPMFIQKAIMGATRSIDARRVNVRLGS